MKKSAIQQAFKREFPWFMIMPALLWQVLFFYIPCAIIIALSFIQSSGSTFSQGFSLNFYKTLFAPEYGLIILRSLIFASLNALVCLVCAYPVAYYLALKVKKAKQLLLCLLILPFWTNVIVQIYAWFFVLEQHGLLNIVLLKLGIISQPIHMVNTMASVFLVMAYCYLPFMIMPLYTALEKIDSRLIESSYDLGANSWQTFFNVTLPLSMSGIRTGFFLVFVPSFGEFVIPVLMGGSKQIFVGSLVSHYFTTAHNISQGAAFTVLSGLILLVCALIINRYFSKKAGVLRG
jgi:spermidine/putrescine transport system permease protein